MAWGSLDVGVTGGTAGNPLRSGSSAFPGWHHVLDGQRASARQVWLARRPSPSPMPQFTDGRPTVRGGPHLASPASSENRQESLCKRNPLDLSNRLERRFDIEFVAPLALAEKQIQQAYRPYIQVHKWFGRRPGSLFRALLLSEFTKPNVELDQAYLRPHDLSGRVMLDPFMGGGKCDYRDPQAPLGVYNPRESHQ